VDRLLQGWSALLLAFARSVRDAEQAPAVCGVNTDPEGHPTAASELLTPPVPVNKKGQDQKQFQLSDVVESSEVSSFFRAAGDNFLHGMQYFQTGNSVGVQRVSELVDSSGALIDDAGPSGGGAAAQPTMPGNADINATAPSGSTGATPAEFDDNHYYDPNLSVRRTRPRRQGSEERDWLPHEGEGSQANGGNDSDGSGADLAISQSERASRAACSKRRGDKATVVQAHQLAAISVFVVCVTASAPRLNL
jgi:hypothetical protein